MSATADRSLRPAPTAAAISGWATKDWLVDLVFATALVAIALVGVLFVWAALSFDPKKAGGLDDALKTVRDQGANGPVMLTVIAVGLIAFGAYCFVWARRPRRS